MIISHSIRNLFSKGIKTLGKFLGIFIITAMLIILFPQFLTQSAQFIDSHTWQLRFMRWGLLITFIFMWNPLLKLLQSYKIVTTDSYYFWSNKKFYIAFWLIIFEIMICENVLFKLIEAI
jgi:hypothetical protein